MVKRERDEDCTKSKHQEMTKKNLCMSKCAACDEIMCETATVVHPIAFPFYVIWGLCARNM